MTSLRQRMINDMTVRGLAENTKKSYLSSVTGLACHYNRSPARISAQEVQDYLIFLHEERGVRRKLQQVQGRRGGLRLVVSQVQVAHGRTDGGVPEAALDDVQFDPRSGTLSPLLTSAPRYVHDRNEDAR